MFRSSCPELSYEKGILKSFPIFWKHLCWSLLFNKVAGWKALTLLKRDPSMVLSCEFSKIFKNTNLVKRLPISDWLIHWQVDPSVYWQANINTEKGFLGLDLLLIHLI